MPSKSAAQRRTMLAAINSAQFRKKMGIPLKVAKEFIEADRKAGITTEDLPERVSKEETRKPQKKHVEVSTTFLRTTRGQDTAAAMRQVRRLAPTHAVLIDYSTWQLTKDRPTLPLLFIRSERGTLMTLAAGRLSEQHTRTSTRADLLNVVRQRGLRALAVVGTPDLISWWSNLPETRADMASNPFEMGVQAVDSTIAGSWALPVKAKGPNRVDAAIMQGSNEIPVQFEEASRTVFPLLKETANVGGGD